MIYVRIRTCDGVDKTIDCETLEGAREWAMHYVGEHPEFGSYYAVSSDGIATVSVTGCDLKELFNEPNSVYVAFTLDAHDYHGPFVNRKCLVHYIYYRFHQMSPYTIIAQPI